MVTAAGNVQITATDNSLILADTVAGLVAVAARSVAVNVAVAVSGSSNELANQTAAQGLPEQQLRAR